MDSGRETHPLPAIAFSAMHPSEWETLGDRLTRPLIRKVCEGNAGGTTLGALTLLACAPAFSWHCRAGGNRHLSLVNLDPKAAASVDACIEGHKAASVSGRILTAPAMDTHNTFDAPNRVQPAAFSGATLQDSNLKVQLPPRSVVVLTLAQ